MADKSGYKGFNPIKEEVDGKRAHSVIWTTKSLEMAIEGLNQGKKLIANPFYENNTKILKGDLVFQRTPYEESEFIKCMNDIVYFANTYCKLMTPEGIKKVTMRDYQMDYLKHLCEHQLSIFLSCRQSGKCNLLITNVLVRFSELHRKYLDKLGLGKYRREDLDCYDMPMFELYNLTLKENNRMTFKWRIKYILYKILYKLVKNLD